MVDKYFTKKNYILFAVFSSRFSDTENTGCDSTSKTENDRKVILERLNSTSPSGKQRPG